MNVYNDYLMIANFFDHIINLNLKRQGKNRLIEPSYY